MSEPPRVIVNADDFGLHPAINEGIEHGHRDGMITSASLMTLGPALDDAVRRARSLPALDLGLHFTLVGVPGLPSGLGAFFAAYLRGQLPARVITDALYRQLDLALRTHKLLLSHIDSHQHLHAFPPLMRVVCRVAA
ncbi:MAG: ChbG/HpnK family deacetylase, partial [Armatimonadota bacterium]|nr:ChbG/HpnK family deacetylase [Armatimonadota bacterium]